MNFTRRHSVKVYFSFYNWLFINNSGSINILTFKGWYKSSNTT